MTRDYSITTTTISHKAAKEPILLGLCRYPLKYYAIHTLYAVERVTTVIWRKHATYETFAH